MFSTQPFNSILELLQAFPDEQACINHLERVRWEGNVISPFDKASIVYKCSKNRYKCRNTNKYFNVRTGTIFEGSKIPLTTWVLAIYLFTSHKRGISSYQMAKDLNITQKSAWFLLSRIRYAMEHENFLKEMEGVVEADESFIGGKNKNRHKDKKVENSQGRSFKDKTPVFGLLERGEHQLFVRPNKINPTKIVIEKVIKRESRVKCVVVPNTTSHTIQPIIFKEVKERSSLMSDEWWAYQGLNFWYNHGVVDHKRKQYVNGEITTNGIENFWSHLKRSIIGTYYKVSRKHLQQYTNEIAFRFNSRSYTISDRLNLFLQTAMSKRLTYQKLVNG